MDNKELKDELGGIKGLIRPLMANGNRVAH